ncbi:protein MICRORCHIDIA 7-like [Tripterygium wilfordii]|uniref:protein MICRORCHIDIA 7-like n=1 Tax=Tripterygium wilfordii TaxID=458696 RepID=UPI0018F81742|nr:protein MICRORCHIDIA 7-like [Tripterygium wilfordii]
MDSFKREIPDVNVSSSPSMKQNRNRNPNLENCNSTSSGDSSGVDDYVISGYEKLHSHFLGAQEPIIKRHKRDYDDDDDSLSRKKRRNEDSQEVLPPGFLAPMVKPQRVVPPPESMAMVVADGSQVAPVRGGSRQFWKAGDYEGTNGGDSDSDSVVGLDHVRVHPKFLHSNATSHKWALGAFAELLDNAVDEICNGATCVLIDVLKNKKDGSNMLLIEDNGGGMTPQIMRQCMSLGYSVKSKEANTIGQYGNGFKTSTMRLGADVIVFSRCRGSDGKSPTQSIGLLSYSFLRGTGKQDIVVPMVDYEKRGESWNKIIRTSTDDWDKNLATIVQWSPYQSEKDLLNQFNDLKSRGTRIIIYNLWDNDEGNLELDFDTNPHDIQIRGVNRDEKNIEMAKKYCNSRHYLTYKHSLRSYASILYLRLPSRFRIILRGKDVEHHNIENDMILPEEKIYKPTQVPEGIQNESDRVAVVKLGFVKDAPFHIDVQGFNVYHKNRLIKPFWRVWNAAGSDGRGVIGALEANFIEPAHDKQGFERTTVLGRLEARLNDFQKNYWRKNCHEVGYAPRRNSSKPSTPSSPDERNVTANSNKKISQNSNQKKQDRYSNGNDPKANRRSQVDKVSPVKDERASQSIFKASPAAAKSMRYSGRGGSNDNPRPSCPKVVYPHGGSYSRTSPPAACVAQQDSGCGGSDHIKTVRSSKMQASMNEAGQVARDGIGKDVIKLQEGNRELRERVRRKENPKTDLLNDLQHEIERCQTLETQLQKANEKVEEKDKELEVLIEIFAEERTRREEEELRMRNKLKEANETIDQLLKKVKYLEGSGVKSCKTDR